MKKLLNILVTLIVVLVLPCAFLIGAKNGLFKVRTIDVVQVDLGEDEKKQIPEAYEDYFKSFKSNLSKFDGENLWDIDLKLVKEFALKEPWIESVEIYRRLPQTLRLEVKPKSSIAIYLTSQGNLHLLSSDGKILPKINQTKSPRLPVIQNAKIIKDGKNKEKIVAVLNEIASEGHLKLESIAEVHLGSKNEVLLTDLNTKSLIKLGNGNVGIKSARVAKVLEYLDQNNLKGRVIDADFSKKVLVKLRNGR